MNNQLKNILLFLTASCIWGTTWIAIKFQLGDVAPIWSLVYRFCIAFCLMMVFCKMKGVALTFNRREHLGIALQALLMFSLNFYLFYLATAYFVSGIIAVFFAGVMIANIIFGRIFLKSPINPRSVIGALMGLAGLFLIIWNEIVRLEDKDFAYLGMGIALALGGVISASLGQLFAISNSRAGIPTLASSAIGFGYGALFTFILALSLGEPLTFSLQPQYVLSLLYLAIFGTIIGFMSFLTLVQRIGHDKASYAFVLLPIIAMAISSVFEDFTWTLQVFCGMGLVLLGNVFVLAAKARGAQPVKAEISEIQKAA